MSNYAYTATSSALLRKLQPVSMKDVALLNTTTFCGNGSSFRFRILLITYNAYREKRKLLHANTFCNFVHSTVPIRIQFIQPYCVHRRELKEWILICPGCTSAYMCTIAGLKIIQPISYHHSGSWSIPKRHDSSVRHPFAKELGNVCNRYVAIMSDRDLVQLQC